MLIPERMFGAHLVAQDRTFFSLWAPNLQQVELLVDARSPLQMTSADDGWFELEVDCGAGAHYAFRLPPKDGNDSGNSSNNNSNNSNNGGQEIPDPASYLQADDVHGRSVVVDLESYQWRCTQWRGRPWHEVVLYELHVGAIGGFAAVGQRLPALAALGITAIELMPIADFPGERNWGYDGVLHYAPESSYGTPDELRHLIDTAHELGMMVFLDVVYNHFGPDGNFLGTYAKTFFRHDVQTPWGDAIDFRVPQVQDFFVGNAAYWLNDFRFDGLRFDALHAIREQGWLPEMAQRIREAVDPARHVHLIMEHEENAAHLLQEGFTAQWNDDGHHALHVLLTGENQGYYRDFIDHPAEKLARCLEQGFIYQGHPSAAKDGAPRGEPSGHLPPTAFVLFLQNHDQIGNRAFGERLTVLADARALCIAHALLLLSPQIPLLFMGEEIGATNPFYYFTDHHAELGEAVRDGRRNEFSHFKEFSDFSVCERIPDPNDATSFSSSIPDWNHPQHIDENQTQKWGEWIGWLLTLRHAHIMPRLADTRSIGATAIGTKAVLARWRMGDGAMLSIAINLSDASIALNQEDFCSNTAQVLFETGSATETLQRGRLPAFGFIASIMHVQTEGDPEDQTGDQPGDPLKPGKDVA